MFSARMIELRNACVAAAHQKGMGIVAMKVLGAGMLGAWSGYLVAGFDPQRLKPIFDTMKLQFLVRTGVAHSAEALGTTSDPMKLLVFGVHGVCFGTARTTGPRATPAA